MRESGGEAWASALNGAVGEGLSEVTFDSRWE